MKDKSLNYIDDSFIQTGEFLSDISSDPRKLQCLNVFIECQSIVHWIQTETEGRIFCDIANFQF